MSERRPSFDSRRDVPSYDDKQHAAVSRVCTACGGRFACTDPATPHDFVCSACQHERWAGVQGGREEDQ